MNNLSPIVLFVYNRPWHTQQTIEALQKNKLASDSQLFIYSDGEKTKNDQKVAEVREYIKTVTGFKKITIVERETNWGLADNIIDGVTTIVNKYGKIIVLEDDIVTSPAFLEYMNNALSIYENEEKVMHISGYFPNVKHKLPNYFFYNQTSCWGWATWANAWSFFSSDTIKLFNKVKESNRVYEFNIDNSYPFLSHLEANIAGRMKTWAIKWHTSVFLENGLCLHPYISFVRNIGFDNSGEHCNTTNKFSIPKLNQNVALKSIKLKENKKARLAMKIFNLNHGKLTIMDILRKYKSKMKI